MMSETVELRTAAPGDGAAILGLLRRVSRVSDAVLVPHLTTMTADQEDANLAEIDRHRGCLMLLATLGTKVVGLLTVMPPAPQLGQVVIAGLHEAGLTRSRVHPLVGELGVVVDAPYWHQGIGSLLVDEAQYWQGTFSLLDWLMLTVFDTNAPARHLYRKQGFTELGTITEAGRPARLMVWSPEEKQARKIGG